MIGGDGIDGAVGEALTHRNHVGEFAQRWVHLEDGVEARQQFVGEREVMRCRLGRNEQSFSLGSANEVDALRRRQVQKVNRGAGEPRQFDIAKHHQFFGYRWPSGNTKARATAALVHHGTLGEAAHFAVLREQNAEALCILKGPAHEQRILHACAVVGEDMHASSSEFGHWGEHLASAADGDATAGQHFAQPGMLAEAAHHLYHRNAVVRRLGVRHRNDCGEATQRRSTRTSFDSLGFFAARLTQVHVQIDKTWADHAAAGVEHSIASERRPNLGDDTALDTNIANLLTALVENCAALDNDRCVVHVSHDASPANPEPLPRRSNKTAMRTLTPLVTC
ncbi:unannotated protein [freshwater metagenome]|uniref:Unannotated protein n=1 Tax=freshwater metagenome TaxID=449393 RepID=A0A6J6PFV0_9ZZZZ